jgi:hypothetical protein
MIRCSFYFGVAALMIACTAAKASAQSAVTNAPLTLLAIPEGSVIMCREPPPDPKMLGAVYREFSFGSPVIPGSLSPREVAVAFDSAGRTIILTDDVQLGIRGTQGAYTVWPNAGDSTGKIVVVTVDSVALAAATARGDLPAALAAARPPVTRDLSPDEWGRARALGAWLWKHRCGRK